MTVDYMTWLISVAPDVSKLRHSHLEPHLELQSTNWLKSMATCYIAMLSLKAFVPLSASLKVVL